MHSSHAPKKTGEHLRPGPFADPQHCVKGAVGAQAIPAFGDRDRSRGGQRAPNKRMPLQIGTHGRVVGRSQDNRELVGGDPAADREVSRAQRSGEGGHFLAQYRRCAAHTAALRAHLTRRRAEIEGECDRRGMAFPGGPGPLDQVAVGRRGPAVVVDAMPLPPLSQTCT